MDLSGLGAALVVAVTFLGMGFYQSTHLIGHVFPSDSLVLLDLFPYQRPMVEKLRIIFIDLPQHCFVCGRKGHLPAM